MSKHLLSLTAAAVLCAVVGCGGGEYARRVEKRVEELNAQFAENFDQATELPGMRAVLFRPLKRLGKSLQERSSTGKELPPQRLLPPIVLPHPLRATYEVFVEVKDMDGRARRIPFYCYLLAEEDIKQRDPYYVITERAQGLFGDELEGPRDVACLARDGKTTRWRWLRGVHKWHFFVEEVDHVPDKKAGKKSPAPNTPTEKPQNQTSPASPDDSRQGQEGQAEPGEEQPSESESSPAETDGRLEATIEIYARREGGEVVVIIWLIPQILEQAEGAENPPPSEQLRRQFAGNVEFLNK